MNNRLIAFDTETTGVDFAHGTKPFFVTMSDRYGNLLWWEWYVDPLTREPKIPEQDVREIADLLRGAEKLVAHNAKFDVAALNTIGVFNHVPLADIWPKLEDTLIASHLLASGLPHDLTSLCYQYLGLNIAKEELTLKTAVQAARRYARSNHKDWRIAKSGELDMPSVQEATWQADYWLPKALAELGEGGELSWHSVLSEYANVDSAVTAVLWEVIERKIRERKLDKIYGSRIHVSRLAYQLQDTGVTVSGKRTKELQVRLADEANQLGNRCKVIAGSYGGYELELPRGGRNQSLDTFMFDVAKFPISSVRSKTAKTDKPSMNKEAMVWYLNNLPSRSKEFVFVESLLGKRARDTALSYLLAYERFWLPLEGSDEYFQLFPNLNPTGSSTLRWSCKNPNEQNISKREGFNLRYAFGPAEGEEWWSFDAKNIELRIPNYYVNEEAMVALFEQPDEPPYYGSNHLLIFHILHPELWEAAEKEVGKDEAGNHCKKKYASTWYQRTKNGNFAVQYGAIDRADGRGTADRAYGKPGAQAVIKSRFRKLDTLNKQLIAYANKYGYVETLPDRTVDPERGYPLMCTRTEYGKILPTVPLNYFVQGSAMSWTSKAMWRTDYILQDWNKKLIKKYKMVMQVHDEIVFAFPKRADPVKDPKRSNLSRAREIAKTMALSGSLDFGIPTPVGIEYHADTWATGVTF